MRADINCWEYFGCGREPGGNRVHEQGVCPAASCALADGLNHGRYGGRICWSIAGTLCDDEMVHGSRAQLTKACHECPFLDLVQDQEGRFAFQLTVTPAEEEA